MSEFVSEPTEPQVPSDELASSDFQQEYGEPLRRVLDLDTWHSGADVQELYERLEAEVAKAISQENRVRDGIRSVVFPKIRDKTRPDAPPLAGIWTVGLEDLQKVHRGILFAGDAEACDGSSQIHDSLALTIIQIGICLVSYSGSEGTWAHRLYRRDLRGAPDNPIAEAVELLEAREHRSGVGRDDRRDHLTELGSRGIMTYAERAVLTRLSTARWRIGHGNPAPYEILTGAGAMDLVGAGLSVLRDLLLEHRRFVFVPSAPRQRGLLTVGLGLRPLEFAVVRKMRSEIQDVVELGHLRGDRLKDAQDFVQTAGEQVAIGVFRVSAEAPPYVFYAPADPELCAQAATIAMADAALQDHRGFPLLLDMAHQFCQSVMSRDSFASTVQAAYAAHGRPMAYLSEREGRR